MTTRIAAGLLLLAAVTHPAFAAPRDELYIRCLATQSWVTPQQSVQACTSLIESTSRDQPVELAGLHDDRARTYQGMKRLDLALGDMDAAVKLQPNDPNLLFWRALLLDDMGRTEDSVREMGVARRAGSAAENVLNRRGFLYVKLDRLDDAMADFTELLKISPGSADGLFGRGVVRLKTGEIEAGKADIARAKQIDETVAARSGLKEYQY